VKAYHPVEFDTSTKRNLTATHSHNGRIRNSASKTVSNFTDGNIILTVLLFTLDLVLQFSMKTNRQLLQ